MTAPVLTFFNYKGGVGKTSLVYHTAGMLAELGHRVLAVDLDPQANLTAAFLDEEELAAIQERPEATGAAREAHADFEELVREVLRRVGAADRARGAPTP